MAIVLGPVLGLRSADDAGWRVSVLTVSDGREPKISVDKPAGAIVSHVGAIGKSGGRTAWRSDITVAQGKTETKVVYRVGGLKDAFTFFVPPAKGAPRMSYGSCNGFSDPKAMKSVDENNHLWDVLFQKHAKQPYHLMLLGGDQIYADSLWAVVPPMRDWLELSFDEGNAAPFSKAMKEQLDAFFFDLYCSRWSQPQPAKVLASVPAVMMWDDHDIMDGWGSYKPARQNSRVYQGLYAIARKHFITFQLHGAQSETPFLTKRTGFSYAHNFGKLGVLALDMRSERSQDQVMSPESWNGVLKWMDGVSGLDHLLVMSSIPVVHPSFTLLESLLGFVPGQQGLEDDLKDHWTSRSHQGERVRLIHRLLRFADAKGTRVSILSGDVHIAALGLISRKGSALAPEPQIISQLTSSGIVHPAPPALVAFALERLFDNTEKVEDGITASMERFPGTQKRFLAGRNWLSLEPDSIAPAGPGRIWANWFAEGDQENVPYTKVIHPIEKKTA